MYIYIYINIYIQMLIHIHIYIHLLYLYLLTHLRSRVSVKQTFRGHSLGWTRVDTNVFEHETGPSVIINTRFVILTASLAVAPRNTIA